VKAPILISLVFAVLLGIEWRWRLRSVRLAAVFLALVIWFFAQPVAHRAARRAISEPVEERVTRIADGPPLSDYASGVATMERDVMEDVLQGANFRLICEVVVLWLACSPVLRRAHITSQQASGPNARKGDGG
jgi:hypothetical protein